MFRQSLSPFEWRLWGSGDILQRLRSHETNRPRQTLAKRLEEQQRELQQLSSSEDLPHGPQRSNDVDEEDSGCNDSFPHALDDQDGANVDIETLSSCPVTPSASCSHNDGDELDSPITHPPRTVTVRAGDLHVVLTPKIANSMKCKKFLSFGDSSTISTDSGAISEGSADDLSVEEDWVTAAAATLNHDEWEIESFATAATYPPTTITFLPNNPVDAMATPRRSRMHRHCYSDLSSSTCCQYQKQFPALPTLDTHDEYYKPLYKSDMKDEAEEDEDQIPHAMSPNSFADDDDDDTADLPYAEIKDEAMAWKQVQLQPLNDSISTSAERSGAERSHSSHRRRGNTPLILDDATRHSVVAKYVKFSANDTEINYSVSEDDIKNSWLDIDVSSAIKAIEKNERHDMIVSFGLSITAPSIDAYKNGKAYMVRIQKPRLIYEILGQRTRQRQAVLEEQVRQNREGVIDTEQMRAVASAQSKWGVEVAKSSWWLLQQA
jgi:hypothetical protein